MEELICMAGKECISAPELGTYINIDDASRYTKSVIIGKIALGEWVIPIP